jgi:hypothetical protein
MKELGKPGIPPSWGVQAFLLFRSSFSGLNGLIYELCKACYFFIGRSRSKVVSGRERFIFAYPLALKAHTGKNTQNL